MEDATELIAQARHQLGPAASDEEIRDKVLETIEALPESERAGVLEQLVKELSSRRLRHLDKQVNTDRQASGDEDMPHPGDGR